MELHGQQLKFSKNFLEAKLLSLFRIYYSTFNNICKMLLNIND